MTLMRLLPDTRLAALADYLATGGGHGLLVARALSPEDVIGVLEAAGLRGRGGAGFPTGRKWRSVRAAAASSGDGAPMVVNASEGEPGTAKDRELLWRNPYVVIEGLLIGLHALDAPYGVIAIKAAHGREVDRLRSALQEVQSVGWPLADRVEIVLGPDDYLFGEESAMLEVIEGHQAMPRVLKPYDLGLFASEDGAHPNPTVVNNVETVAHVAQILDHGADWFREVGTEASPGTMLCTVVGDVPRPGIHEVALGTPLRHLVVDLAGGDDDPKMIASGVSNQLMTADHLDVGLCFDELAAADGGLGSGGFVVYDRDRSVVRVVATLLRFLADESCGQCNSCHLGTAALAELLEELAAGRASAEGVAALVRRAESITDEIRCFLPVGGQLVLLSAVQRFRDEFMDAVDGGAPDGGRAYPVPLIDRIDTETGVVSWKAPTRAT